MSIVFAANQRKVVIEDGAGFTAGFAQTLLLENDRYRASVPMCRPFEAVINTYTLRRS